MRNFQEDIACRACGNTKDNAVRFIEQRGDSDSKLNDRSYIQLTCSRCGFSENLVPLYRQRIFGESCSVV